MGKSSSGKNTDKNNRKAGNNQEADKSTTPPEPQKAQDDAQNTQEKPDRDNAPSEHDSLVSNNVLSFHGDEGEEDESSGRPSTLGKGADPIHTFIPNINN